jgi:wobble nucleotide-excising tRNase
MITEIEINGVATFQEVQKLKELRKFNYFFGANGSGKTTISRIIDSPDDYSCSVTWKNKNQLERRVYNRNFVVKNFNQQKLPGVFTLGETAPETLKRIDEIKDSNNKLQDEIDSLKNTLQGSDGNGGKKAELSNLTQSYKTKFFTMKQKHSEKMSGTQSGEGMRGFIGSQEIFMNKVLTESVSNTAALLNQTELEEKAETIFSNTLKNVNSLQEINTKEELLHEEEPILQKRIIGKDDVDIAAMIMKLNNSDWVSQGVSFYEVNDGVCPFCQQSTSEIFRKSLTEYFDETYTQDSNAIKSLIDNYAADTFRLLSQVQELY